MPAEPAYDESQTSTLYIPFAAHLSRPETGHDTMIIRVPDELVPPRPATPRARPEIARKLLEMTRLASRQMRETCREASWWITRDPEVIRQCGEGDRCPTCMAGVDRALEAMRDDPDAVMAVGRLSWCR